MLTIGRTAQPDATDSQTQDYNRQWAAYLGPLVHEGVIESAAPLEARGKVVDSDSISDLDLKEIDIGGYAIVRAESLAAAVEIARHAPHIALGGQTIVRRCIAIG
jgi:YCII-related domain